MRRTAWLLTGGDWALAEDLVQAAFSEVWRHWPRVSVMEVPEAYAHKVMLNTFLSRRRRRWTVDGGRWTVDGRDFHRTNRCFTSDHWRIRHGGHA
jgi:DNA-directed RNA polymerase specialized sigma24 family protein